MTKRLGRPPATIAGRITARMIADADICTLRAAQGYMRGDRPAPLAVAVLIADHWDLNLSGVARELHARHQAW